MSQRQINAAHARSFKPHYKGLTPPQKRLVKLQEEYEILERSINNTYRFGLNQHGKDFRNRPDFQKDMELIYQWTERKWKILESISRLEAKHNLELLNVLNLHNMFKRSYCYGGSY